MTSSAGGRASEGSLQIMYGIGGEHDLTERELSHLRGWRDSAPVRVGNGAWGQTQLDVYGELLNSLYLYREQLGELHPEIQRFVADLADTAARRWREKGAGMWEMRGEPRHHLSSKVLCWWRSSGRSSWLHASGSKPTWIVGSPSERLPVRRS